MHRDVLPDARSTALIIPSTTKYNRRIFRAVTLNMDAIQKTTNNKQHLNVVGFFLLVNRCTLKFEAYGRLVIDFKPTVTVARRYKVRSLNCW